MPKNATHGEYMRMSFELLDLCDAIYMLDGWEESKLRESQWVKNGCNGFDLKIPTSNPMSFRTEQDVLIYIKENNLPICSVYGDIVVDYERMG